MCIALTAMLSALLVAQQSTAKALNVVPFGMHSRLGSPQPVTLIINTLYFDASVTCMVLFIDHSPLYRTFSDTELVYLKKNKPTC